MIPLDTERLRLRDLRSDDLPALIDLWTDPEVTRFAGGPRDVGELRRALEEDLADPAAEAYNLWPVEERATGRVVGHCGLLDKDVDGVTEIELAYFMARSSWGNGYATEIACALRNYAFEAMRLSRVISLIDPTNAASKRVAVKVGMRWERDIVRPSGALRSVFAIGREPGQALRQPRISGRALIVGDARVLVSCYEDADGPWYVLPGGGQRSGETLRACVVREVKEETCADVTVGRLRWVREFVLANHEDSRIDPGFHQVELIFECQLIQGAGIAMGKDHDAGQTGLHWFPIDELLGVRFYPRKVAAILAGIEEDRIYLGDV